MSLKGAGAESWNWSPKETVFCSFKEYVVCTLKKII